MAMSDCIKCWETPCACGHDYQHWTPKRLKEQIEMLQRVLAVKEGNDPDRNKPVWDTSKPGNW